MQYRILLLLILLGLIFTNTNGFAQNLPTKVKKIAETIGQMSESNFSNRIVICESDSVLGYFYNSPSDSVLDYRQIFEKDGSESTTIYTYYGMPPELDTKDSTAYDIMGRPTLNEFWRFKPATMSFFLEDRTYAFPHDGNVISAKPYILSAMEHVFYPSFYDNVNFDSLITYVFNYFSEKYEFEEKTVNVFSAEGRILETQIYRWDTFNAMDWYLNANTLYYYNANGRLEYTENYGWDGKEVALDYREDYTYDAQDSLLTLLTTNEVSGIPEEKLEITYHVLEGTILLTTSVWDEDALDWIEMEYTLFDYDELGRLEALESVIDFDGEHEGDRIEYKYIDDEPCPEHAIVYYIDQLGEWALWRKYFFDPVSTTSTNAQATEHFNVFPNPTSGGVWMDVPAGLTVQLTSLQGEILFQGRSKGGKEYLDIHASRQMVLLTFGEGEQAVSRLIFNQN